MSRRGISRLGAELALAVLASVLVGMAVFAGLNYMSWGMLDRALFREEVIAARERECIGRLQDYVTSQGISLGDKDFGEKLDIWAAGERRLFIVLYKDGVLLYSNDWKGNTGFTEGQMPDMGNEGRSRGEGGAAGENVLGDAGLTGAADAFAAVEDPWGGFLPDYEVRLKDGTVKAGLICFYESGYYAAASGASALAGAAVFALLLFCFIRVKMKYIALLEREICILKGGDLDYVITVKGKDELSFLAREIDHMRQAVKERQEQEEEARRANRELVTAMSHDLRTPLTSLLGYVDILRMERWRDEEQRSRCIRSIHDKAYEIKSMSDKLFEYFIVYGTGQEELRLQEVNGAEFLGQVVEESLFDMESQGFVIERFSDEIHCRLMADMDLVRRVFGNIFSNLVKYGDQSYPVRVDYEQREGRLIVRFTNFVNIGLERESSRIGLRTCRKIMKDHGGRFSSGREGDWFVTEIEFVI